MENNKGFIVLVDISGYTRFVRSHRVRKIPILGKQLASTNEEHAETIISDLLEKILEELDDTLIVNKLQGDAALFYAIPDDPENFSEKVIAKLQTCFEVFNTRLHELVFCQTCPCDPCQQVGKLKLKSIVHYGDFLIKKVSRFEEIAGEDVILAHRLMKNSVEASEYLLYTDNVAKLKDFSYLGSLDHRTEQCEGLGNVDVSVFYPEGIFQSGQQSEKLSKLKKFRLMTAFFKKPKTRKLLEDKFSAQHA